jgi:hypothetical protein
VRAGDSKEVEVTLEHARNLFGPITGSGRKPGVPSTPGPITGSGKKAE